MHRLLTAALPLLLLAAPAPAVAKRITSATICGADACRAIDSPGHALLQGGPPTDRPSAREPFVRLDFRIAVPGHTERVRNLFLPRIGLVLADDGATWLQPSALAELRHLAGRVTPFPASTLPASAPLAPAPAARPVASQPGAQGGAGPGWLVLPVTAIVLAAGVRLVRRRRDDGRRLAGATG